MASLDELLHEVRRIGEHREVLTEKKIKSIYKSLEKDLTAFLGEEYVKYADKDGKLFLSYLDSQNKRAKFLEEIAKNVDSFSPQVKREMLNMVNETYEKAYKGIAEAVLKADDTKGLLSMTDTLVRPEVLKRAVKNNIDKLTLPAVLNKHRAEIIADIQQTLNVGLMNGDRYETMAKRIKDRLGVSYSKAMNIARTESHRNIESGLMDGAKETSKIIEQDGDLIYAATWRTMQDSRVRPQQMRKTKKGWVKTLSRSGANHMKMEGVTIKVGEKFKLEPSVYAECPSMSGTARNDCNCRCFLQYNLMTVAEFAKATGQTEKAVREKYNLNKQVENAPEETKEQEKPTTTFESMKLTGIDEDYLPDIKDTFEGLMRDYPVKGLNVKTNRASSEFGHFTGGIKGIKKDGKQYAIFENEICISKASYESKALSIKEHIRNYEHRKSALKSAKGVDLATIPHEYGHAIDSAYVLAKDPALKAFADKYKTAQKINIANIDEINDFNRAIAKSDKRLSKEIFDELQKEYGLDYMGTIMRIDKEYGSYASSSVSEFFAEAFANMRLLDDKDKTDFMRSFERIFNRKFNEVFGG